MIASFRNKGLEELFSCGRSRRIASQHQKVILQILDLLANMGDPSDCVGVRRFHALKGERKGSFSLWVSGNYRITFRWAHGLVHDVDFEDYH